MIFFLREKLERINFYFINNNQKIIYDFLNQQLNNLSILKKRIIKFGLQYFRQAVFLQEKSILKFF